MISHFYNISLNSSFGHPAATHLISITPSVLPAKPLTYKQAINSPHDH